MPELPEVETVCRGLEPFMAGQCLKKVDQRRPNLRIPFPKNFAARLKGKQIEVVRRRAKYILMDMQGGETLIIHLGMSGRMTIHQAGSFSPRGRDRPGTAPHDHVVFDLESGTKVVFTDPRRFGLMDLVPTDDMESHRLFVKMGIEPLGNQMTPDFLKRAFKDKRTPIKATLLDQRIVAGIGNIYACEALFGAQLSPRRSTHTVKGERAERLVLAIRQVLRAAIEAGGSTLRDYVQSDGELGYFQHAFQVYSREGEPCVRDACKGEIKRLVQAGRSSFYCPKCQR